MANYGLNGINRDPDNFKIFDMIDNYIYFYHLDKFIILPLYSDNINDSMGAQWNSATPLGRSAPIQSYGSSGPRTLNFSFDLHRDMMTQINAENTSFKYNGKIVDVVSDVTQEDYVDIMLRYLQTAVVPNYRQATKMVDPPVVAVRMGQDLYIKGVVGNMQLTYHLPILRNGKYAYVSVSFSVTESDPFSAEDIATLGSNRIVNQTLERKLNGTFISYDDGNYTDYINNDRIDTIGDNAQTQIPRNTHGEDRAEKQAPTAGRVSEIEKEIIALITNKSPQYKAAMHSLATYVLVGDISVTQAENIINQLNKTAGLTQWYVDGLMTEFKSQLANRRYT